MNIIVETKKLSKSYPNKLALNNVNMHVYEGDIYGFIGKNGAGKTTTMKLLLGLSEATEGEIKLFGSSNLNEGRKRIGSLIEAPGIYKNYSAYENMKRFAILYGADDCQINELLKLVGLDNVGSRKAGNFSLGMRQRLGIAISLLGNPKLLILDEPINGLDPSAIKDIRDLIIKLNKERNVTFIISSHLLTELSLITTRYGIISSGRLVEEISAEALKERCKTRLNITCSEVKKAIKIIKEYFKTDLIESDSSNIYLYEYLNEASSVNELLVYNGIKVSSIHLEEMGFENYFIERLG